jgi:hypothetical protein
MYDRPAARARHAVFIARLAITPVVLIGALMLSTASAAAQSICFPCEPPWQPVNPIVRQSRQLVVNSGFEDPNATLPSGVASWTGWHMYYTDLRNDPRFHAHCRNNAMYLAGRTGSGIATVVGDGGHTAQRVNGLVIGSMLDFWIYFPNQLVEYEEVVVKAVDVAQIPPLTSTTPIPWTVLTTPNNRTLAKNAWQHVGPIDMTGFAGQDIILKFQARTDLQYPDASPQMPVVTENGMYIDDITIWTPGLHFTMC